MENKKLTLEDLKLESFLTEIDNSKLVKVQGGNGGYADWSEDGTCQSGDGTCETPDYSNCDGNCETQSVDACTYDCTTVDDCPESYDCGTEQTSAPCDEWGDQTETTC